jgi:dienelactone hydrolase
MLSTVMRARVSIGVLLATLSCARLGNLGAGQGRLLLRDASRLPNGDPGRAGPYSVDARGWNFPFEGHTIQVVSYRPANASRAVPGVVFIPGRAAAEDQYESYGRLLASHGLYVLVRGGYDYFHPDDELVREIRAMGAWLAAQPGIDRSRMGVAGHSMGGRNAIAAAAQDPLFRAIVGIDPGSPTAIPIIEHVLPTVRAPLLLIGAERGWRAMQICSERRTNYEQYFKHAPAGTVEMELVGADHVQLMDHPDGFGMFICRSGTADSTMVRTLSRRATAAFLLEHLTGAPHVPLDFGELTRVRVRAVAAPTIQGAATDVHESRDTPQRNGHANESRE